MSAIAFALAFGTVSGWLVGFVLGMLLIFKDFGDVIDAGRIALYEAAADHAAGWTRRV